MKGSKKQRINILKYRYLIGIESIPPWAIKFMLSAPFLANRSSDLIRKRVREKGLVFKAGKTATVAPASCQWTGSP